MLQAHFPHMPARKHVSICILDARIVRVESLSANECGINLFGMTGPAHP